MSQEPEKIILGMISAKSEDDLKTLRTINIQLKKTRQPTSKSTISMVIISYNRKCDLGKCIRSILNQTVKADEILVVDNASTDGTIKMIRNEFPEVSLFALVDNKGLCYAANVGFKNAKGDYVGIVESDMILSENWIEDVKRELDENPDAGIACPMFLHWSKYGYVNCEFEQQNNELFMVNGCFAIRKSIIEENNGDLYDPKYFLYAQEEELSARVFWLGLKIMRITTAKTYHNPNVHDARLPELRRQRYNTRNNFWNLWRFYSKRNILLFTPIYMVKFLAEIKNPVRYARIMFETFKGIPYCFKRRRPVRMDIYESFWKHLKYRRNVMRTHWWFDWKSGNIDPKYLMRLDGIDKLKKEVKT